MERDKRTKLSVCRHAREPFCKDEEEAQAETSDLPLLVKRVFFTERSQKQKDGADGMPPIATRPF